MVGLKIRDVKSPDQLVNILLVYTFPTTQTLNLVLFSVRNKSILNNYIALNLVRQFAQTSLTVLSALDATTLYSNEYLQETKQLYKASVLKTLPDVMLVFGCWDKVVAFQDVQQGENKAADIQTLFEHTGASLSDVLVTVEQVLCLYQDLNPQLLIEHPVILGKLLDGILLETHGRGIGSPSDHMTRVYLLKLLAGTDARRLPWSKKNSSGHTLLYQLLEMVTQLSADDTLSTSVIALVCKAILKSSSRYFLLGSSVTDCRKFVETGCLGYTLAGLSSHDEDMRCAALHVIDAYQTHLSVSKIPEKEQLGYFLELLQNSLPSSKFKLSSIITQFLAKTATLLLKPDEHMYVIMNNFLLLKPVLDTQNIPEFFKLFNSSDMQYKTEQSWILSLMGVGLRETADYRIFKRCFTFKLVLSFYDSVISDYQMQLQVLEMLLQACRERSIVRDICQNHGFLVWLNMAATKLDVGEAVHLQFTETLLSVMSHMSGLSHDSRGHLVQTVSHSDIFLLLLQGEKQWTQSTMTSAVIQNILNVLEINSKNLMAAGSKDKHKFSVKEAQKATNEDSEKEADDTDHGLDKTLESTTEQTGYSQTVSKTTVKPAITSAQSDRQKLSETILRVILAWKSQVESVSQLQNYVVDFVVLQWVLHHLHSETTADAQLVGAVIDMLNTNLLTDRNSMLIDTVLESGRRDEIMADLLRLYALVYDKCRDLDMSVIEPAPAARISRTDMITKLNDVLLNVMKHKDGGIKMNADKSHQLYTAEVASVDVRKMFL